jgi:hypothetical protein
MLRVLHLLIAKSPYTKLEVLVAMAIKMLSSGMWRTVDLKHEDEGSNFS